MRIIAAARDILAGKAKAGRTPRLWDEHNAERIIAAMLRDVSQKKQRVRSPLYS